LTNLAAEARTNAQANWPGASVNARGRNWIRHQHPTNENRFILDSHIGPIHYGVSDDQEIDTAWQPTGGGAWDWEMTLNNFQTYARDTFNVGDIFQFEKDGETLMFDPQSINWIDENTSRQQIAIKQAVAGVVTDDVLAFPEAYGPGRHFQYQNQTARLQKLITIDADTDLPTVTLQGNDIWFEAEFSLSLSSGVNFWLDGVEWARQNNVRVQTADQIEIRDSATGTNVLWWLGAVKAWDSADDASEQIGQLEVRRQGGPSSLFITVRIPKTWIDAATFPIYIDPTIDEQVGVSADDGEVGDTSTFSNSAINVRFCEDGSENNSAFARFTGISISGTINAAYVEFRSRGNYSSSPSPTTLIYADDSDNPSAPSDYTDFWSRTRTSASGAWDLGDWVSNGWYGSSIDISSVIQELVDSYTISSDAILILVDPDGAQTTWRSASTYDDQTADAPKLHIEYTAAGGDTITPLQGKIKWRRLPHWRM
jgi:hypothetical protein